MSKASTRFEPTETLQPEDVTVGSIVLYQSATEPGRTWPALVNQIVQNIAQEGVVNLHVFTDYYPTGPFVSVERNVTYDMAGAPGTWRWE